MNQPLDEGPFFHGTKANLRVGDLLRAGFRSNYRPEVVMNHIYFTALQNGAGLAAELAAGDDAPRVYTVEPTGAFENDPNVTDKKFPGNPTRSYRSSAPLRVVGEVTDWTRLAPEELQAWKDRLAALLADERGEIINRRGTTAQVSCRGRMCAGSCLPRCSAGTSQLQNMHASSQRVCGLCQPLMTCGRPSALRPSTPNSGP